MQIEVEEKDLTSDYACMKNISGEVYIFCL